VKYLNSLFYDRGGFSEGVMPIYEYKASGSAHCELCQNKFEVRQGIDDEPLKKCPKCGAEVKKLFSLPFLCLKESLSLEESFATHTEEEAEEMGLEEGFAEDEIWD
jgi:putative FmdB family regulatory protein